MAMRLALCLLTRNEIDGCRHDVPNIPLSSFDAVYCVDGNSTDGTIEYLESVDVRVIKQQIRGYNGAYIEAFDEAARLGMDAVIFYHPKGAIDPAVVLQFREPLENGNTLVIASRICKGAINEEDRQLIKPRKWFVIGMGSLLWICFGRRKAFAMDVLHGCRAMRTDSFMSTNVRREGLTADLEMVVGAYRLKQAVAEFPVTENPRLAGETHFKALPTGWRLIKYVCSELVHRKTGRA